MSITEGADGFKWEHNIGEEKTPLAGGASEEWWREVEGHDGEWWRITEEYDVMGRNPQFFLRLWEKDKDAGKTVLKSSGFAPIDTLARAQEGAREYETKQVS